MDPYNLNLHNLSHCELQPTFLLSKDIWSLRTEAWKLPQPFLSIKVKNAMNKKRRHFWHCFVFCKVAKTQLGSSSSLLGNLYIKWTDSNSWVLSLIFLLSWTFVRSLNCQQLTLFRNESITNINYPELFSLFHIDTWWGPSKCVRKFDISQANFEKNFHIENFSLNFINQHAKL